MTWPPQTPLVQGIFFGLVAGGLFGGFVGLVLYDSGLNVGLAIAIALSLMIVTGVAFGRGMKRIRDEGIDGALLWEETKRGAREDRPLTILDALSFAVFLFSGDVFIQVVAGVVTAMMTGLLIWRTLRRRRQRAAVPED